LHPFNWKTQGDEKMSAKRKTMLLSSFGGLTLGVLLIAVVGFFAAPTMMIVEGDSKLSYDETIAKIQQSAKENHWSVPAVHTIDKSVAKAGHTVRPVTVIELCQPHHAAEILSEDEARVVTSMMPCRVSVYQTEDGRVVVSRMNTSLVANLFGGTVTRVMANASQDQEKILSAVLD
jgi:uncharacterized protein (DUF302 family)